MPAESYPFFLANRPLQPNCDLEVADKYSGKIIARVAIASAEHIDSAIAHALAATTPMRQLPAYHRAAILHQCTRRFQERSEELSLLLCLEAGKPIRDARTEVHRFIDTFRIAAEEATRMRGEVLPMDISPRAAGYSGQWKRVPVGPCSFISPFNFPLNLAAHKIAPAIAVGCPFILKPASYTPLGALVIGEILAETDLPPGAFSILPCHRDNADLFVTDERIKLLSFTGSPAVGWALKAKAGKKKVTLELGGNAACIVDEGTNARDAIDRILIGTFSQSGQSCISVQRILVHQAIYDTFKAQLIAATLRLKSGDPRLEDTVIGPLIAQKEAQRLEGWIQSAVVRGATLLCGGKRSGPFLEPTLLEGVASDEPIYAEEAFGPVAILSNFCDFDAALKQVNDSIFGLQAGIFTRDLYKAHRAWNELEVGSVVIGDVPSFRVDHMPYGGVKDSGLGREGIRFSMEEMTEIRLLAVRDVPA